MPDYKEELYKEAEAFLKMEGICLHREPSVVREDGYYDDLRELLAKFADKMIEKGAING